MSEGPFQPEDFKNMDWENDLPVRESAAKEANLHPFVKEAQEKMEYILESDDSTMESRHVAKTFLSKYFPEKESGG